MPKKSKARTAKQQPKLPPREVIAGNIARVMRQRAQEWGGQKFEASVVQILEDTNDEDGHALMTSVMRILATEGGAR